MLLVQYRCGQKAHSRPILPSSAARSHVQLVEASVAGLGAGEQVPMVRRGKGPEWSERPKFRARSERPERFERGSREGPLSPTVRAMLKGLATSSCALASGCGLGKGLRALAGCSGRVLCFHGRGQLFSGGVVSPQKNCY